MAKSNRFEMGVVGNELYNIDRGRDEDMGNALAVMHNLIARATTKWDIQESKLFLCALSKIRERDNDGWVKLSKQSLRKTLGLPKGNTVYIRDLIARVYSKSWIKFNTKNGWNDGALITQSKSDRSNVYIRFNADYLPLLEKLSGRFTAVYIRSIAGFKSKAALSLYLYLMSWQRSMFDKESRIIYNDELPGIFSLTPTQYRVTDKKTGKNYFHYYNFEKFVLNKAIEEINANRDCEIRELFAIKKYSDDGGYVDGYHLFWRNSLMKNRMAYERAGKADEYEDLNADDY